MGPSIRDLNVEWGSGKDPDQHTAIEIDGVLKTLGTSTSDQSLDEWKASLRFGNADGWLVVLLLLVPFLKRMDMISSYPYYFPSMLGRMLKGAFGSVVPLQHLKIASIRAENVKTHYTADELVFLSFLCPQCGRSSVMASASLKKTTPKNLFSRLWGLGRPKSRK